MWQTPLNDLLNPHDYSHVMPSTLFRMLLLCLLLCLAGEALRQCAGPIRGPGLASRLKQNYSRARNAGTAPDRGPTVVVGTSVTTLH